MRGLFSRQSASFSASAWSHTSDKSAQPMFDEYDVKYIAFNGTDDLTISVRHAGPLSGRLVLSHGIDTVVAWRPNTDEGLAALTERARLFVYDHPGWTEAGVRPDATYGDARAYAAGLGSYDLPVKQRRALVRREHRALAREIPQ